MPKRISIKMGIDPGWTGALAVQSICNDELKIITYDCPQTPKEMFELVKQAKNELIDFIAKNSQNNNDHNFFYDYKVFLEKVHSFPGMSSQATWTFAKNYAYWQMALIANEIPFKEVSPLKWINKIGGVPKEKKKRKIYIKNQMEKLYPFLGKITLKNADALGILSVIDQL